MSLKEMFLFKITNFYLSREKNFTLEGPYFYENPLHQKIINEIIDFRKIQNKVRAPHLEEASQLELEKVLKLDERSAHFIARMGQKIVISLRLTPGPFELASLSNELEKINQTHQHFWEFSRLCTELNLPEKGKAAKLLLVKAGLWLFSQTQSKGIIAICQESKVKYMSKFALCPQIQSLKLKERSGSYALISAPRDFILAQFMREFLTLSTYKLRTKKITAKTQPAT